MDMIKIGYKLVKLSPDKNHLLSLIIYNWKACVKYVIGEEAFPAKGNGPLCVFTDLEYVKPYIDEYLSYTIVDRCKIYKCSYIPSESTKLWYTGSFGFNEKVGFFPEGTVLADSVTLLEEITI